MKLKVNDIVYQKRRGFSGVPMRILEINGDMAICRGAKGWRAVDLWSDKWQCRVGHFNINNLSKEKNNAM